jgi:hypothetical protein
VLYVMTQAGHSDPKMTLGVYAQVIASRTDQGVAIDGLISATDWAHNGRTNSKWDTAIPSTSEKERQKSAR